MAEYLFVYSMDVDDSPRVMGLAIIPADTLNDRQEEEEIVEQYVKQGGQKETYPRELTRRFFSGYTDEDFDTFREEFRWFRMEIDDTTKEKLLSIDWPETYRDSQRTMQNEDIVALFKAFATSDERGFG